MKATRSDWMDSPAWSPRLARWFLVAAHLPFMLTSPIYAITGLDAPPARHVAVPLLAGLAIGGLQLRHSLAAVRAERPRGWSLTLPALIAAVYLPMPWFTWNWVDMQVFAVVSIVMLLRGRLALVAAALPVLGTAAALATEISSESAGRGIAEVAVFGAFWLSAGFAVGVVATYGSVWLVRVVDELYATRTELAEVAIGRERLRVSRDLHDLLGQSLSAVSLKGDLALRLLSRDAPAARAQIEDLTSVARDALAGMRAVTKGEHSVSLGAETDGAAALLGAAGVEVRVDVRVPEPAAAMQDVLAWAVREGVTNVLRHSTARTCSITALRRNGTVRLEIINDGVRGPRGEGTGLAGLTERVRRLSGSVSAGGTGGRFRLLVEIPEEAA